MKIRKKLDHIAGIGDRDFSLGIDPTEYADLLFGVGSATSAGPTLPAGSIHPSPETLKKDNGGYTRGYPIVGFGHAYISGSGGVKCYGNFLLCPMLGEIEIDKEKRAKFAVEGTERARCYEYSVTLENGIKTRVTPAHSSAIHLIEYPQGADASLMFDVARKLDNEACMKKGTFTVDAARKMVYGGGTCSGNLNGIDWDMFFALEFDSDFSEIGTFTGEGCIPCTANETTVVIGEGQRAGAYIRFGEAESGKKTVKVKVAISFVSAKRAIEHLVEDIPSFDYDAVRDAAREKWREQLGVIELKTDDKDLLRRFYTAMYHMNIQPRDRTDDHGLWDDFHTVWDTWKTVFPMYSLLYADKMGAIIESFIDRARKNAEAGNGLVLTDAFMATKEYPAGQGGNDIDNVIVDSYLKGVPMRRYDWEDAYKVLLLSAENMRTKEYIENGMATKNACTATGYPYSWRFKPAAATMGFAANDKAVSEMARELGTQAEYERYSKRAANFLNVWNADCESEGFYGFPQRREEDGHFDVSFDAHGGYNSHFYEATSWDASYFNYNDVPRLVEAMGGAQTFTNRLVWACEHSVNYYNDDHGAEGYLNFTNEPSFHIPWLFCTDQIKRPDLAAKVIDGIIKRFSQQNDYPGDEDNGGMSSYYIFLMCGFFPYATTENYYLHGTRLEKITFRLSNGREFVITGENVKEGNIYVQSATYQGKPLNECKLTHEQILAGGELHFVMGECPSDWARG